MRKRISKAAFILTLVFLSGCGRSEIGTESRTENRENIEEVSAKIESVEEVSAEPEGEEAAPIETEDGEGISEKADAQYPLIAAPSTAEWIDLVIVSEGSYCIFDGEKYGFLREDGEEIAPFIYDIAYPFNEGLACVCQDGKYGYIDLSGEIVLPFDYDRATPFVEGLAYFSIGDTYGFMDKTGTQVFSFECDSVGSFQEGLAYFSKDGRYGYIDQDGQIAIEPMFDDAGYFKEGLAQVMKDGRYGVIDRNGDYVIAAEYDSITVNGSFIITQSNGECTYFNRMGKILLEHGQDDIYMYYILSEGEYSYFKKEGKEGLMDEKGNILIEPLYDGISLLHTPKQNFLEVYEDGLCGVVDLQGEVRIPVTYSSIYYNSYADSAEGGMFLLTDADGNMESMAIDFSEKIPCSYDSIDWLSRDKAVVSLDGLSGIIDREGKLIEPIEYDRIRAFTDGAIWLKKGEKSWFYTSSGEAVEGIDSYDDISQIGNCYRTEKNGDYGFLNDRGEEVVSPVYDNVSDYKVYGCSDNVYILTDYSSDIRNSIIKVGEPERVDLSRALLQNEITPRCGLFQEFMQGGTISVDFPVGGHTESQEELREYRKTYKLYDLKHSGELLLYFKAEPYVNHGFPLSYSGFYAIQDNQLVELFTGYECGGSMRGDYVCLWYDKETSQVLPGIYGAYGGFGGYATSRDVYDRQDGEMACIVSFDWMRQPASFYSDEELEHAELFYDDDDQPYTKERIELEGEECAQKCSVNGVQTTMEAYQAVRDRYWMLSVVE